MGCGSSTASSHPPHLVLHSAIQSSLTPHAPPKDRAKMTPIEASEDDEIARELREEYAAKKAEYDRQQQAWQDELHAKAKAERERKEQHQAKLAQQLAEQAAAAEADEAAEQAAYAASLDALNEASRLNLLGRYSSARSTLEAFVRAQQSTYHASIDHWSVLAQATQWQARYAWVMGADEEEATTHRNGEAVLRSSADIVFPALSGRTVQSQPEAFKQPTTLHLPQQTPTQRALVHLEELLQYIERLRQELLRAQTRKPRKERTEHLDGFRTAGNSRATTPRPSPNAGGGLMSPAQQEGVPKVLSTPLLSPAAAGSNLIRSPLSPAIEGGPKGREPAEEKSFDTPVKSPAAAAAVGVEESPITSPVVVLQLNGKSAEEKDDITVSIVSPSSASIAPSSTPFHPSSGSSAFSNLYTPRPGGVGAPTPRVGGGGMMGTPRSPGGSKTAHGALKTSHPFIHHSAYTLERLQQWKEHTMQEIRVMKEYLPMENVSSSLSSLQIPTYRIRVVIARHTRLDYRVEANGSQAKTRVQHRNSIGRPLEEAPNAAAASSNSLSPTSSIPSSPPLLDPLSHSLLLLARAKVRLLYQVKMLESLFRGKVKLCVDFVEAAEVEEVSEEGEKGGKTEEENTSAASSASSASASAGKDLLITRLHHTYTPSHHSSSHSPSSSSSSSVSLPASHTTGPVLGEIEPKGRMWDVVWSSLFRGSGKKGAKEESQLKSAAAVPAPYDMLLLLWNDNGFYSYDPDESASFAGAATSSGGVGSSKSSSAANTLLLSSASSEPHTTCGASSSILQWILPFQMGTAAGGADESVQRAILMLGIYDLNREHSRMIALKHIARGVLHTIGMREQGEELFVATLPSNKSIAHPYSRLSDLVHRYFDPLRVGATPTSAILRYRYPATMRPGQDEEEEEIFPKELYLTNRAVYLSTPLSSLHSSSHHSHIASHLHLSTPGAFELWLGRKRMLKENDGEQGRKMQQVQQEIKTLLDDALRENPHNAAALILLARYELYVTADATECVRLLEQARKYVVLDGESRVLYATTLLLTGGARPFPSDLSVIPQAFSLLSRVPLEQGRIFRGMRSLLRPVRRCMAHVWSVTASEIKHRRFLPLGWKADSLREIHRAVDQFELDLRKRVWEVVQKACERAERVAPLDVRAFWSGRATYARALMRLGDVETALKVLTPVEGASSAAGSGVPLGITLLRATCLLRLSKHPDALTLLSSLGPSSGGSSGRCLSAYLATWSAASVPKEKVGEMFARAHALIASEPNSAPCPLTLHREAFFLLRRQANRSGAIANWQSVIELTSGTPERKVRREAARLLYDLFAIRTDVDIKPAAANFSHTNKAISGRRLIHVAVIQSGLDHLTTTRRLKARPTDFTVTILSPQDLLSTSLRLDAFDVLLYHPRCTALLPDSAFYSQHHRACQLVQAFVQAGGGFIGVGQAAAALMCDEEFGIRLPLERLERNRKLRGEGLVSVNVSQAGATMLHAPAGATLMRYSHGPLLLPTHSAEEERRQREEAELRKLKATAPTATAADLAAASQPTAAVSTAHAAIEFLAHFSSDVTISGVLTSLPAIVRTRLSSGQVVLFAAMPIEQRGQAEWIERAIEQAGRK